MSMRVMKLEANMSMSPYMFSSIQSVGSTMATQSPVAAAKPQLHVAPYPSFGLSITFMRASFAA